jgi:hypothetical protein
MALFLLACSPDTPLVATFAQTPTAWAGNIASSHPSRSRRFSIDAIQPTTPAAGPAELALADGQVVASGVAIAHHHAGKAMAQRSLAADAERLKPWRNTVTIGVTITHSQPRFPLGLPSAFPVGAPVSSTQATGWFRAA